MLLGARFVCLRCGLRGPARACPECGAARLDLADEGDRARLLSAWPMAEAWRRGVSVLSPRSIRRHRPILALAVLSTAFVTLGAPASAALDGEGAAAVAALVLGVVLAPLWTAFFAVFFFYYAHVLRLLAALAELLLAVLPFGRARLRLIRGFTRWASHRLAPVVRPELDGDRPERVGRLVTPLVVRQARDGLAWLACADGWTQPFEIELEGRPVRVDPAHGALRFATTWFADAVAGAPGVAPGTDDADAELPAWLASGRRSRVRRTEVPAGRPVRIGGGRASEGALAGTPEAPLAIEIG